MQMPIFTKKYSAMKCPNGHEVADGSRFCNICGAPIPQPSVCPNGHVNPEGSRFCNVCGSPIGATAPAPQQQPQSASATASVTSSKKGIKNFLKVLILLGGTVMIYSLLATGIYYTSVRHTYHDIGANVTTTDEMMGIYSEKIYLHDGDSDLYLTAKCEAKYKSKVWIFIALSTMLVSGAAVSLYSINKKEKQNKQTT